MRCRFCRNRAIIQTIEGKLCEDHFKEYLEKRVQKTIEKYKLFSKKDKILVAVSGGKDSSTLAFILNKLGYNFEGLYINLEIKNYSDICENFVKKLFRMINKKLNIVKVSDFGVKIKGVGGRDVCSVCGIVKRYIMNKFAYENSFDVLVTAHNLDDILSFILLNALSGNLDLIYKSVPSLPKSSKFVKKVKPLCFVREKESLLYALLNKIPFAHIECPYAIGNTQNVYKRAIMYLESINPTSTYNIYKTLLKMVKNKVKKEEITNFCKICGMPTNSEICSFCRLKKYFENEV